MPSAERVHRHAWIPSSVIPTGLAGVVAAGLAACAGGHAGKLAASNEAAPMAPSEAAPAPAADRPGLGTSWGETVSSPIQFTEFERASAAPWAELALHYNDAEGALAHARYLGVPPAPLSVDAGDGALSVALVDDDGRTLPGFTSGGRTVIVGEDGERYRIVVRNATDARFEIVASVDGLDVRDGQPADPARRGYLIDPHGVLAIDGFRTSEDAVAAFRFGRVADSYAAQTGSDRNVGVIGVAIFAERGARWTRSELRRRDTADPFPHRGYAVPPR
ncbi:MAG TPA: hypothetical protein VHW23_11670 [Kofleriaceae bacterium]|jgi:hypothetical protein|nr:hypothetical protein [Kofleriaceae bacterium]